MKVRNVLALAAANLGREDLIAMVNDCAGAPSGELSSLLRCYNLVENEIALDYFPLRWEEILPISCGEIPYEAFAYAPVEVLSAEEDGRRLGFALSASALRVEGARTDRVKVRYLYSPAEKGWEDDCAFPEKISARLLSFGVCSEYCLTNGKFGEAAMWEKKFREALRAANVLRKKLSVRSRRWA